ncbi:M1 family aminopeptidase [Pseudotenacibaculum sp. MALMAid0570]|uniref:M1 family aminopeptidase n=1 Tax=Pseudotenacibaculum sp. MALMAid0570 TaxID=3143938 RepID=UPI0032E04D5A
MRKIILLFIIAFTACQENNQINYEVTPSERDGKPALNISMEFKANPDGETVLLLQDNAWGQENLYNTLSNLKSEEASEIIKEKDSNRIILKHDKGLSKIRFSYTIQQDTEGKLTTLDTYRPVIQKDFFHVFSHNLFMLPRDYVPNSKELFDVEIHWNGFNDDFSLVNSFETNFRKQQIKNTNERYFHSAVFTGGDYRAYELDIKGNKAVFGIRGNWEIFNDSTIVSILEKTLTAQRNFWQDHSQKYFAVTMTPTYMERGSGFQGSGLTNSFATTATNNKYLELEGLVYLFNHELQHNWTGHVIRNENEEEQYWFSEGFTDYYTFKNIAKNNIANLNESFFISKFNESVMALYTSPVKEAPNSEINYDNFWSSRDYGKLPYRRGAVFAFYLDSKIRKESNGAKSLDDLMLEIKEDAVKNNQKLNHKYFLSKANQYLKEDLTPFFTKHIINGELFDLEKIYSDFNYDFTPTSNVFDLGLVLSEDRKEITEIDENSNAYKVGLRKGDQLSFRGYYYGNPAYEAEFKVVKNGKETHYKYFPARVAKIPSLKDTTHNKNILSF